MSNFSLQLEQYIAAIVDEGGFELMADLEDVSKRSHRQTSSIGYQLRDVVDRRGDPQGTRPQDGAPQTLAAGKSAVDVYSLATQSVLHEGKVCRLCVSVRPMILAPLCLRLLTR